MYLRENTAVHRMNYTYPASSSLFFCRITFVSSHFAVCLLPQQRRRSVDEGLLCLNAARKIRHNIRKSLITARDVYAYVRLYARSREAYVADPRSRTSPEAAPLGVNTPR